MQHRPHAPFVSYLCALCLLFSSLAFAPLTVFAEGADQQESGSFEQSASSVNINTASAQEIADALTGVGLIRAEAIVAYRQEHGPFSTIEGLLDVKGIGQGVLKKNTGRIKL